MEIHRTYNSPNDFDQDTVGGHALSNFRIHYKATLIKTVALNQDRHLNQWNRVKHPEINSYERVTLILTKFPG
jgi:hypothetical protein